MKQQIKFIKRHAINFIKRAKLRRDYLRLCRQLPLDDNLVFLESFQGRGFSDSPKALYLHMMTDADYSSYHFVISLLNPDNFDEREQFDNERTTVVESKSDIYYQLLAQSKYVISNSIFDLSFKKRAQQNYIQTWHGTPLKRIGWDIKTKGNNVLNRPYQIREMYRQDAVRYDLVTSPSRYFSQKFISAFALSRWGKSKVVRETGYPRNDALITSCADDATRIRDKYGIPDNKTVVLYAPTWREDKHTLERGYEFDIQIDLKQLAEKFGNTHVFIFKMHQFVSDYLDLRSDSSLQKCAIDLSHVSDINELFLISDLLITDYSSVLFDYAILQRPMIFYMYDLEKYEQETRGFYLDVNSLPGPIAQTQEELFAALDRFEQLRSDYSLALQDLNDSYNYLEDGNSSKRVVEIFTKELL